MSTIKLIEATVISDAIIVFSSRGVDDGKFTFYKAFVGCGKNIIFVNDPDSKWYLNGTHEYPSYDQLLKKLKSLISSLKYYNGNLNCIGTSMGGYASLRYGEDLEAKNIIVLGPELELNLPFSRSSESISNLNFDKKPASLKNKEFNSKVYLFYGSSDLSDLIHASDLNKNNPCAEVYLCKNCNHAVAVDINKIIPIGDFFLNIVDNSKIPDIPFIQEHRINYVSSEKLYKFYIAKSFKHAFPKDELNTFPEISYIDDYATILLAIGREFLLSREYEKAELCLRRSVKSYDRPALPRFLLSQVLLLRGHPYEAKEILQEIYSQRPTIPVCVEMCKLALVIHDSRLLFEATNKALSLIKNAKDLESFRRLYETLEQGHEVRSSH